MNIYQLELYLIFIITGPIFGQKEDSTSQLANQLIENLIPEPVTNYEEFNIIDYLEVLQKEPININTTDISTLQKLPGLDINYAQLIVQHREKYGHYFSINELFTIKGLPRYIINNIKPFITISDPLKQNIDISQSNTSLLNFARINIRSRISEDLGEKNSLTYGDYPGSRLKIYSRVTLQNEHGEAGIITEKDPGEISYIDFISFHLYLKNIGPIQKAVLGDYIFEFGHGLVLGGLYGFSKATDAIYPTKSRINLFHPYSSTDENRYFRGIAFSSVYDDLQFSLFYSTHKIDASTDSISGEATSLITSGYHRSSSELINHNSLKETSLGICADYLCSKLFNLGVLYFTTKFNNSLSGNSLFSPKGNSFNYFSTSYECLFIPTIILSGETAYDFKSVATINSIQISFNKNFLFVTSIRNYPKTYNSLFGNSLAEQGNKVQNETGFYNGFKILTEFGTFNFYYDQFKFPFGSYRFPISNAGEEFMLSYTNIFIDDITITTKYKNENKDYLLNQDDVKSIVRRGRDDFRILLSWKISNKLRLISVAEYNAIRIREDNLTEEGLLLSNSLLLNLSSHLTIVYGISTFKTDSFFSSVYENDNNIEGLIRGELLYGEGIKIKLFISYKILKRITISAQYAAIKKPKEILINPIYSSLTDNVIFQCELQL
ncbi:MAG: helix-hairpin-helix domain-containing protein [Ignavibacteriaceae bacterium]|nr:helix-hairpin-helix domain-containing protein [Ignavibacteriaceae bacterium]